MLCNFLRICPDKRQIVIPDGQPRSGSNFYQPAGKLPFDMRKGMFGGGKYLQFFCLSIMFCQPTDDFVFPEFARQVGKFPETCQQPFGGALMQCNGISLPEQ